MSERRIPGIQRGVILCYHEQHYLPTQESLQPDTQAQQQGILGTHQDWIHQSRIVEHTRCSCSNALGIVALLQKSVNTADWKLQASF